MQLLSKQHLESPAKTMPDLPHGQSAIPSTYKQHSAWWLGSDQNSTGHSQCLQNPPGTQGNADWPCPDTGTGTGLCMIQIFQSKPDCPYGRVDAACCPVIISHHLCQGLCSCNKQLIAQLGAAGDQAAQANACRNVQGRTQCQGLAGRCGSSMPQAYRQPRPWQLLLLLAMQFRQPI